MVNNDIKELMNLKKLTKNLVSKGKNEFFILKQEEFTLTEMLEVIESIEKGNKFDLIVIDKEIDRKSMDFSFEKYDIKSHNKYFCNYKDFENEINDNLAPTFLPFIIVTKNNNLVSFLPFLTKEN